MAGARVLPPFRGAWGRGGGLTQPANGPTQAGRSDQTCSDTLAVNPGSGYLADSTSILIASPASTPSLEIAVSKVNVTLHVILGRKCVILSSPDLVAWSQVGDPFIAQAEHITREFAVSETGRYFKIQEAP